MYPSNQRDVFFETIYELYYRKLETQCLHYANYSSKYWGIIEESIQETFLTAVERYNDLQTYTPSHIEAWLRTTCRNRFEPALRKYRLRQQRLVSLPDESNLHLSPDQVSRAADEIFDKIADRECSDRIWSVLNDRERKILDMRYQQDMTFEDIAAQENTTAGAVKGVLARLNKKVKKEVKDNPNKYFIFTVSILFLKHLYK